MDDRRVITANIPEELAAEMDSAAKRLDRSRSWIIRSALIEWLAEEEHRRELTFDALADVDAGRTMTHEEALAGFERSTIERRRDKERRLSA